MGEVKGRGSVPGAGGAKRSRARGKGKRPKREVRRYTPEDRRQALEAYERSDLTIRDFCATWGVSTKTFSGWKRRYRELGPKGLETKRVGRKKGTGTIAPLPGAVKGAIAETKRRFPDFGLRKIRHWLARFRGVRVSVGSVQKTLVEEGLSSPPVKRKPRRHPKPPKRFERARAGEMWQSDITSFVLRRHHRRVYLTVFLDDHSRFITGWALAGHQRKELVEEAFHAGVQGRQYVSWRGKSRFQKLLFKDGIEHIVSRPHHPQTLGKCERLWRTVGEEFWNRINPEDLSEARERLGHFISHYNHFRPHQGIDGAVPADRFFGVEDAVRAQLEAGMSDGELSLAIEDTPRQRVFLTGRIGDRALSLHGERGKVVIQTEDGLREEIGFGDLGAALSKEVRHGGNNEGGEETTGPGEAGHGEDASKGGSVGEAALEVGERRGAGAGTPDRRLSPAVLAWAAKQGGGGGGSRGEASSSVAAEPDGGVGHGGGTAEAAASAWTRAPGRERDSSQEAGEGARAGSASGAESGDGAASDAAAKGGGNHWCTAGPRRSRSEGICWKEERGTASARDWLRRWASRHGRSSTGSVQPPRERVGDRDGRGTAREGVARSSEGRTG